MARFLFVQAHPDDLELDCSQIMHYTGMSKKHQVFVLSATKGEFGLPADNPAYNKFKGEFLARWRVKENLKALAIHTIPLENVTFLGYIDGFVPFNREIIKKVQAYLQKIRPHVIFAPEPLYTWYLHNDHYNIGRCMYYCIHHHLIDYTPKLFFYTANFSNFYFPFHRDGFELADRLLQCHKSQFWLLNSMKMIMKPMALYHGLKVKGYHLAEPYRRVFFNEKDKKKNRIPFAAYCFSFFFWRHRQWYLAQFPDDIMQEKIKSLK